MSSFHKITTQLYPSPAKALQRILPPDQRNDPCHPLFFPAAAGPPVLAGQFLPDPGPPDLLVQDEWDFGAVFSVNSTDPLSLSLTEMINLVWTTGAWSVRRLTNGYTGQCFTVRRDSDDTTTDIGFLPNGDLDQASLLSFVGAGNGYVRRWYDQSGHLKDFVQNTSGAQPQLVSSGVVLTDLGGRPCLDFNGSTTEMNVSTGPGADAFIHESTGVALTVFRPEVILTNNSPAYDDAAVWSNEQSQFGVFLNSGTPSVRSVNDDGGSVDFSPTPITVNSDNIHVWTHVEGVLSNYHNTSTPVTTLSGNTGGIAISGTPMILGRNYSSQRFTGKISELVFWILPLEESYITFTAQSAATYYSITWS